VLRRPYAQSLAPIARRSGGPLAAAILMLLPAVSLAATDSGGGGVSPSAPPSGAPTSNPAVHSVSRETASGDGITLSAPATGVVSRPTRFSGTAPARDAGKTIELQRTVKRGSSSWVTAAEAPIGHGGRFALKWRADHSGKLAFRAVVLTASASAAAASPSLRITVFHLSRASWYGPGFFGDRTACGKILRRSTLGVANRTLPCGTRVLIMYGGRTIRVPVIDRGPYVGGIYWDLTEATARALGITETTHVGTLFP
jgi:rare lipoprotein A